MIKNILILGGEEPMGQWLLQLAINQFYNVTVLVSSHDKILFRHVNLEILRGDVLNYTDVKSAAAGQDAVLSVIENSTDYNFNMLTVGTQNIIRAIEEFRIDRWICMSLIGSGSSSHALSLEYYIHLKFRGRYHIMKVLSDQEKMLQASAINYVLVQVGKLTDDEFPGHDISLFEPDKLRRKIIGMPASISREDAAYFMLNQLLAGRWLRKTIAIMQ